MYKKLFMPEPNKPQWCKRGKDQCKDKNMENIQSQDKMLKSLLLRCLTVDETSYEFREIITTYSDYSTYSD